MSVAISVRSGVLCLAMTAILGGGVTSAATPDLSGPWEIATAIEALKTTDGKAPPLTTEGMTLWQQNQAHPDSDPMKECLPPGTPRLLMQKGFPFTVVVGDEFGVVISEWNHLPRPIFMNKEHFENIGPTYLGQSVGHWQGDTLVIDTNGFNDQTWLDATGLPHSEALHVVERIRLKDANTLEDQLTIADPAVFSKAWSTVLIFKKRAGYLIKEDYCLGRTGQGVTVSKSSGEP